MSASVPQHELSRYGSHGQQTGSQRSLPLFGPRGLSVASIQVERAGKPMLYLCSGPVHPAIWAGAAPMSYPPIRLKSRLVGQCPVCGGMLISALKGAGGQQPL
ncbi:hypothetical protein QQF64_022975 [Cirrhinus molitorella]|uniref:Uncharacterized protein n=1 Tax=Cirrhinus molitorella TaxID=172907 RepID=A0ABR3L791_9TELE